MSDEKSFVTPDDLAREMGLKDGKSIRAFLRTNVRRDPSLKGTEWKLSPEVAQYVRENLRAKAESAIVTLADLGIVTDAEDTPETE
jgi:hypothetical protein